MDCRDFLHNLNDYVDQALADELAESASQHAIDCASCALLAGELKRTRSMVQSVERKTTPIGFDERLKRRLAAESAARSRSPIDSIYGWFRGLGSTASGTHSYGHRHSARPALAGFLLCAVVAGGLLFGIRSDKGGPEMDWAYIQSCRNQHASFVAASPLNDESATMLVEQADNNSSLDSGAILD